MAINEQLVEVERNYDAFQRNLSAHLKEHAGEFALMRDRQVLGFFKTVRALNDAAVKLCPDGRYSIQEVSDVPIDLGFFSHAVP